MSSSSGGNKFSACFCSFFAESATSFGKMSFKSVINGGFTLNEVSLRKRKIPITRFLAKYLKNLKLLRQKRKASCFTRTTKQFLWFHKQFLWFSTAIVFNYFSMNRHRTMYDQKQESRDVTENGLRCFRKVTIQTVLHSNLRSFYPKDRPSKIVMMLAKKLKKIYQGGG